MWEKTASTRDAALGHKEADLSCQRLRRESWWLSHCSMAVKRHHDQDNYKRKQLIGGLFAVSEGYFIIIMAGSKTYIPWTDRIQILPYESTYSSLTLAKTDVILDRTWEEH